MSFVAPLAAGSGIPEIKTYLNGVHIKGETSPCLSLPCGVPLEISSLQSLSPSLFSGRFSSLQSASVYGGITGSLSVLMSLGVLRYQC